MPRKHLKFTLEGAHEGKDFTPRFAPQFQFKKGVLEVVVEDTEVAGVAHLLKAYGATYVEVDNQQVADEDAAAQKVLDDNEKALAAQKAGEADDAQVQKEIKEAKKKGPRDGNKTAKKPENKSKVESKDSKPDAAAAKGEAQVQPPAESDLV